MQADIDEIYEVVVDKNNFDKWKLTLSVPEGYTKTADFIAIKNFINNNYDTSSVKDIDDCILRAIKTTLREHVELRNDVMIAFGEAKDIIEKGWENACLSTYNDEITDFFLTFACRDKPFSTLPRKE